MLEHRLKYLTPLGGTSPRIDDLAGLRIVENPGIALASIACRLRREVEFAKAAERFFGFAMPGPGKVAGRTPYNAIWTAADQWLVEAPFDSHEDIAHIVKDGFGDAASVTEQTDGWVRLDLEGTGVVATFERICPLDIGRMPADTASRTLIEHLGCIVVCRAAGLRFTVLGPRSSAASLHHALLAAARSAL